jgi:hypothetical protein
MNYSLIAIKLINNYTYPYPKINASDNYIIVDKSQADKIPNNYIICKRDVNITDEYFEYCSNKIMIYFNYSLSENDVKNLLNKYLGNNIIKYAEQMFSLVIKEKYSEWLITLYDKYDPNDIINKLSIYLKNNIGFNGQNLTPIKNIKPDNILILRYIPKKIIC